MSINDATLERMLQVQERAAELLKEHELYGWRFELSRDKTALGKCYYRRKVIAFSMYFLENPWEEIEDTLLHEVAHALTPKSGHGIEWQRKAIELGAAPRTCADNAYSTATHNYIITCGGCGRKWRRHRLRAGYLNGRFQSACCHAPMTVREL